MRAVVLAAGLGTRLGPLTAGQAKVALEVGGRPIVAHVVAHLARCGFDEIAVNLHYRPEQVRAALIGVGARISWFDEPDLLGTAGALGPMRDFLSGEAAFVVHYGDVLTDHDLRAMLERHRRRHALITMLVHERPASNSLVSVDPEWRVTGFLERPTARERRGADSPWVNSGVYACSRDVLGLLPHAPSDFALDLVPRALAAGPVYAEPLAGFRCAVDAPERLAEAERALADGRWGSALRDLGTIR
jgi:mannose-1-phosphate guanylyltransferase